MTTTNRPGSQEGAWGPGDEGRLSGGRMPELRRERIQTDGLPAEPGEGGEPARPGPGVLVVDDEPAVLGMLGVALRYHGFAVCLAGGGREALAVYRRNRTAIGVVLLDVRMAPWDGPQTLAALREIDPGLGAVFMSGNTGPYSAEELLGMGSARVIQKPFGSLAELAQAVREQLASNSLRPE
jgi:two-component system OmpR family response regulator